MSQKSLSPADIARRALHGVIYAGIAQYASLGIGVIKVAILARLIAPATFGVVALATTWVSFLSVFFVEMRAVIIADPDDNPIKFATQYAVEIVSSLSGLLLGGALYLIAPQVASPRHWAAIWFLLGVRLLLSVTSTPFYILQRDIRQGVLMRLTLVAALISLAASTLLAYLGHPLLALLVDGAALSLVPRMGAWIVTRWRPRLAWDRETVRDSLSFGFTMWTAGVLGKITFEFDDWLVGNLRGDTALGFYSKAYSTAKMPMDVFAGVIGSLATSLYSQSNAAGRAILSRAYRLTTWLLARIIALSGAIMLAAVEEIVIILLSDIWLPVAPLFRLMILYVIGRPLWQNNAQLLEPVRLEKKMRRSVVWQAVILLILGPPLIHYWGAEGASVAVSLMMIVGLVISQRDVRHAVDVRLLPLYLLPGLLLLILAPGLYLLGQVVAMPVLVSLVVKSAIGVIVFGGTVLLFERDSLGEIYDLAVDNLLNRQAEEEAGSPPDDSTGA